MNRSLARGFALAMAFALLATGLVIGAEPDDGAQPVDVVDSAKDIHGTLGHQHGGTAGHLAPTRENVTLIGKMKVNQDREGRIADVGVLGNYAYLAAWSAPDCQKGGVYVFDISKPATPKQIGFIRAGNDSYAGEGVHVVHLTTSLWTGDLLAFNNEDCTNNADNTNVNSHGGATLVDVTSPKTWKYLAEGFGDKSIGPLGTPNTEADAHEIHSIFVWEDENGTTTNADDTAYAVLVDNEEDWDVDILDITDPKSPVLIAEYNLNVQQPQIIQPDLGTAESFFHDVVVKNIGGTYVMLLSYWDGGYVAMNVNDPTAPVYIADSDFANPDPLLFERTGVSLPPEGNAHESEFSKDSDFVVAADEDFNAFAPFISINGGVSKRFSAGGTTEGPTLTTPLSGPTRYVGQACTASPPAAAATADEIAVIERGTCSFQEKLDNVTAAGYAAAIVFNNGTSSAPICEGLVNMIAVTTLPAFFVSRSLGFEIIGEAYNPAGCPPSAGPAKVAGTAGLPISLSFEFDGWGYVHLFSYPGLVELDTYAIPETHVEGLAVGFGDLSVHEVAMSQVKNDIAYFSYYSGGLRVARIDPIAGTLTEVGRFIDDGGDGGNNFWGVQVWQHAGKEYVLASDRDYGLYIFEYTGPGNPNS